MRILVTGGAGFIGSHTVDALVATGAHEVAALDDLSSGKRERMNPAARLHHADLRNAAEVSGAGNRPAVGIESKSAIADTT